MFERYTEKARRVIFFAREEASQFGCPYIETEHLLLGLIREDKALTQGLSHSQGSTKSIWDAVDFMEAIRKQIEARTQVRGKVSMSMDLPLSQDCKQVLRHAAEEAERLGHRHIGTEHVLLGLLREEKCFAAEILHQYGLSLSTIREELAGVVAYKLAAIDPPVQEWLRSPLSTPEMKAWYRQFRWEERRCEPQDALRHKLTGQISLYRGQHYDPAEFDVVKAGWTCDHCAVCWDALFEPDAEHGVGYTNGQDWLCSECYAIVS